MDLPPTERSDVVWGETALASSDPVEFSRP